MLCVGDARVAGMPQRWWAVALPDGRLFEGRGVECAGRDRSSALREGPGVEVVSPHGRSYIWTRKQAGIPVSGEVRVGGREWRVRRAARVRRRVGGLPRAAHHLALVRGRRARARRPRRGVEPGRRRARRRRRRASARCGSTASRTRSRRRRSPPTSRRSASCASRSGRRARITPTGCSCAATTASRSARSPGRYRGARARGGLRCHGVARRALVARSPPASPSRRAAAATRR